MNTMSRETYNLYENIYVRNAIHIVVSSEQIKISDFVRKTIHEKNLSYRKVAEKSGGLITHSTVSDVVNERVTNLSSQTITGLAKGLGVTEQEIFDIVRGKTPDAKSIKHETLAAIDFAYEGMPKKKKERVDYLIELLDREIDRIQNEPDE